MWRNEWAYPRRYLFLVSWGNGGNVFYLLRGASGFLDSYPVGF